MGFDLNGTSTFTILLVRSMGQATDYDTLFSVPGMMVRNHALNSLTTSGITEDDFSTAATQELLMITINGNVVTVYENGGAAQVATGNFARSTLSGLSPVVIGSDTINVPSNSSPAMMNLSEAVFISNVALTPASAQYVGLHNILQTQYNFLP
jgi:hypothetical protein